MSDQTTRPDYERPEVAVMRRRWQMCRAALRGYDALEEAHATLVPMFAREHIEDYEERWREAEPLEAYGDTVRALTGLVFRRPPALPDALPDEVVAHLGNVDGLGTAWTLFARAVMDEQLAMGHAVIVVDYPTVVDPATSTLADVRREGRRPWWSMVSADQITTWRVERRGGAEVLTLLGWRVERTEPDGAFGVRQVEEYRFLRDDGVGADGRPLLSWEVHQRTTGDVSAWVSSGGRILGPSQLPVAIAYGGTPDAPLVSRPPLYALARLVWQHARVRSWHLAALKKAAFPILHVAGRPPKDAGTPIKIGAGRFLETGPDGKLAFVETTGSALEQTRQEQAEIRSMMATHGLSMLSREFRNAETATSRGLDKEQQDSKLSVAALSLKDALEQALIYHLQFLGWAYREAEAVASLDMSTDFGLDVMPPALVTELRALAEDNRITTETLLSVLRRAGVLPYDLDPSAEADKVEDAAGAEPANDPLGLLTGLPAAPPPPPSGGAS